MSEFVFAVLAFGVVLVGLRELKTTYRVRHDHAAPGGLAGTARTASRATSSR
jgi:hypothetical protein